MIRSMTGYGTASAEHGERSLEVELRSVNGRHLKVRCRLPAGVEGLEPALKDRISRSLSRGTVTLVVDLRGRVPGSGLRLDDERVEALLDAFRTLREEYSLPGQVDLPLLVRAGGLLTEGERGEQGEGAADWVTEDLLSEPVERALDQLVGMREAEGRKLAADLRTHLDAIEEGLDRVEERAPQRLERERERLLEAVAELTEDVDVDDDRVARELALLADKWDLGEEISRARAHVESFRELLEAPAPEPVGRRLAFLAQELHRELNTTGAKANDAGISRIAVEMKNELEGIREQVENVE